MDIEDTLIENTFEEFLRRIPLPKWLARVTSWSRALTQNIWQNNPEHSDVSYMSNAAKAPAKEGDAAEANSLSRLWRLRHLHSSKMVCRARILKKSSRTSPLSVLLLALLAGAMIPTVRAANAATGSITKAQSGLVASDSLTSGNTAYWTFGGSAAKYNYYEDTQGLHLGVQSPSSGTWVNYYAGSPFVTAQVFHALLTIPYTSLVGNDVFNPGLYVEGSDYSGIIGCVAWADNTGYYWAVQTTNDAGSTWKTLYQAGPSNLPQTQDCTVVTNGSNLLRVYLGGNLVFSGATM